MTNPNLNKSDDFCMTFTLLPNLYKYCPDIQYRMSEKQIYRVMNCLPAEEYLLAVEETKDHNIHYHTYVKFPRDYLLRDMKKMIRKLIQNECTLGFYKVKTCYDRENWIAYMHKAPYIQHNCLDWCTCRNAIVAT